MPQNYIILEGKIVQTSNLPVTMKSVFRIEGFYYLNEENVNTFFQGIEFPSAIVEVSATQLWAKNKVNGRQGTVKQFLGLGDYEISVEAVVVSENGRDYPEKQMKTWQNIFQVGKELSVTYQHLQVFGIDTVIINSFTINQKKGHEGTYEFSFSLSSHSTINLQQYYES